MSRVALLIAVVASAVPSIAWAQRVTFELLPAPGGLTGARVAAISPDASLVVGTGSTQTQSGILWQTAQAPATLSFLAGGTILNAVSSSPARLAGTTFTPLGEPRAMLVTLGQPPALAQLPAGITNSPGGSSATGISADGTRACGWAIDAAGVTRALLWTNLIPAVVAPPSGLASGRLTAISRDAVTIAGDAVSVATGRSVGWARVSGQSFVMPNPPGLTPVAVMLLGVSDGAAPFVCGGVVVESSGQFAIRPVLWQPSTGQVTTLSTPDLSDGLAWAINANAQTVVGQAGNRAAAWFVNSGLQHPPVNFSQYLTQNGAPGLDQFELIETTAVSADGAVFAGRAQDSLGRSIGFRAAFIQEPPPPPPPPPPSDACPIVDVADFQGKTTVDGGGPNGIVDANDITAFLSAMTAGVLTVADIADFLGLTILDGGGPDGVLDESDLTTFLAMLAEGC
ncbi:MAG: hypothetical protein C0475_08060 [Planctomyces sp.]|nr:hypothetical protein [Planctomyces sp.]